MNTLKLTDEELDHLEELVGFAFERYGYHEWYKELFTKVSDANTAAIASRAAPGVEVTPNRGRGTYG